MKHSPDLNNTLNLLDAPADLHSWITDNGSLTQKLVEASGGNFEVKVIEESWQTQHSAEEQKLLGLVDDQSVLIREVALCCFGVPWVYARSLLPDSTLIGPERELEFLRNKPLGEVLFKHPDMQRGPIQISKLGADTVNQRLGELLAEALTESAWGRASLFYLSSKPLLVSEYFLPSVVQC